MFKPLFKAAIAGSILFASITSAAEFTLKLGHPANEDNIWHKAALKFKQAAEEKSEGRISVLVYPSEQLGKEMDVINSIQLGTADMTITGESLQNWAPKAALMAVPYAFTNSDQLRSAVEGDVGREISEQITERAGLVPLAWFERGARHLTSNRPVRTPDELDGLKLRVPNVPLFVKTWENLGAKPIPMAFSEVFTSLQQNTIDGQENPLSLINSASFFEVQKYVNLTGHVRSWIYVVIGQDKLNSMPDDLQKIVWDAAGEMQTYEHGLFAADEQQLADTLKSKGMEFIEVDTDAFRSKARAAVLESLTPEQIELFEKI
ncbi:C4-dicarboxylate ABC transporter [Marinobacterium aestuarii]|uniref:C4-dicarboxylate ABC transporter n=1 Tax=Marinobacterium aestuarii TaxID=1821621 RepID=A0A1A9EZ02_9GAMM|nr:TRAP transporter substrate-binding protein [Marinobacterium aestuarii]ANG63176.1 C4-dicarboxylate ABC transporter [Marinobacterium aestuarii]